MVAAARSIATQVLYRVLHDDAWAAPTLDVEIRRATAGRSDAALATQIVYGTLRTAARLEEAIHRHARRPIAVDDWTRAALLAGTFQLLHLGRVPPHAVVNDAVALVSAKRGKRVAGFVNAILRKISDERPDEPKPSSSVTVPAWMKEALVSSVGEAHTRCLLEVSDEAPSVDLRVRGDVDRDSIANAIADARPDASVAPTALSPVGLRVRGAGDPRRLPGYAQGELAVQEEGAQLISLLLHAGPGQRVLDACAGRGGKTAQLVEAVGETGQVFATDLHEHRLEQIEAELERLRLSTRGLQTACVDWTVGPGRARGPFDRVLVDAPCTGLGTLRRRPEIALRASPEDAAQMGEIQRRIVTQAAACVAPGGTLLYAVCSPLRIEGADVVGALDLPGFELQEDRRSRLESLYFGAGGRLELGPWIRGAGPWADAYQVYMWVNVG